MRKRWLSLMAVVTVMPILSASVMVSPAWAGSSGSFKYVATLAQASLQPTAWGRSLQALKVWNGNIYAGYGDGTSDNGPIGILPFNLATNTFAASLSLDFQANEVWNFRAIGGSLYAPAADERGCVDYAVGKIVLGIETWTQQSPICFAHAFDMATLTGSDLWEVGSQGADAVAYRSLDGGVTWTKTLDVPPASPTDYSRFYMAGVYNGKLYLQATDGAGGNQSHSMVFDGSAWSQGPQMSGFGGRAPQVFDGRMVYLGFCCTSQNYQSLMYAFDGNVSTQVGPTTFWDYTIDGSTLYALAYGGGVYSTTNLVNWTRVAVAPSSARSIAAHNGTVYVGTTDSKIYKH